MNPETLKLIESLANKLGTTADHLFSVLVKQAPIWGVTYIIQSLVILTICGYLIFRAVKMLKKDKDCEDSSFPYSVIMLFLGAFFGIIILAALDINYCAAAFLNPEYWALKQIIK